MIPKVTGQIVAIFTVRDAAMSASWYQSLFAAEETSRYLSPDGTLQVTLRDPSAGFELCLVSRPDLPPHDRFDEHRVGLDHLEFFVASRDELDRWVVRLDELGVAHSGVKQPDYASTAMLTFRDPDNIQLEFFWPGP